ncbi:MAG: hypothetical protein QOI94_1595 [Acidobacteriaceae bacterium]|jgi:hypothetical protein|nr:hypothetical protein [Acidobacteriaceae bacterium]
MKFRQRHQHQQEIRVAQWRDLRFLSRHNSYGYICWGRAHANTTLPLLVNRYWRPPSS